MYIPKLNHMENPGEIKSFLERFSFATIITQVNQTPQATHLPFIIREENEKIILQSHFAKANIQWRYIEEAINLIIFLQPHAYISTEHYEKTLNVPTWNYIAIHVYGKARILTDKSQKLDIIKNTIDFYDPEYHAQWDKLPSKYKDGMLEGIVAFSISSDDIQAKKKLSQNKNQNERQNIINYLSTSPKDHEQQIAEFMRSDPAL